MVAVTWKTEAIGTISVELAPGKIYTYHVCVANEGGVP